MVLSKKLNRSLKARREEDSDSEPHSSELDVSSPSILDTGEGGGDIQSSQSEEEGSDIADEDEDLDEDDDDGEDVQGKLSKVSFGALAKVQASLTKEQGASRKRKRGVEASDEQEETLRTLRKRLEELKSKKKSKDTQVSKRAVREQSADSSNSSDQSDIDDRPRNRSSKHAPTVQTTKKPVSRKRTVLETQKPTSRDPRFDPLTTAPPKNNTTSNKYSFLKDYRATEISALRTTLSKTKDPSQKETLKAQLLSIESRAKSQAAKEHTQDVIRAHRKQEKAAIEQGKKPFYLKKAEVREKALVQRFEGMSGKERDRALQRRQKKVAGREKKRMPMARRGV